MIWPVTGRLSTSLAASLALVVAMMSMAGAPMAARAQVKPHQATGIVAAASPAQLAILKKFGRNQVRWTFVVNPKTAFDGKAAKGARVRIVYHEEKEQRIADRVKILEPAPPGAAPPAPAAKAAPKASPSPAHASKPASSPPT
jgi:hypothetical protein